jgi:hypothetical protein
MHVGLWLIFVNFLGIESNGRFGGAFCVDFPTPPKGYLMSFAVLLVVWGIFLEIHLLTLIVACISNCEKCLRVCLASDELPFLFAFSFPWCY